MPPASCDAARPAPFLVRSSSIKFYLKQLGYQILQQIYNGYSVNQDFIMNNSAAQLLAQQSHEIIYFE
jgi:hypothetical protein